MRRQGNREFGVYMPPSGEDSVRQSSQVDLGLISRLNNVEPGRELGIVQSLTKDPNQRSVERSNQTGIELIIRVNNVGKAFDEMIRQGWGGNTIAPAPAPAPTSISTSFVYPRNPVSIMPLERPSEFERKDTTAHPIFPTFTIPEDGVRVRSVTYYLQMGIDYIGQNGRDAVYKHRIWVEHRGVGGWSRVPKGFTFPPPEIQTEFSNPGSLGCFISSLQSVLLWPNTISYGAYTSFHSSVPPGFERCQPLSHFVVYGLEFSPDLSTFNDLPAPVFQGLASSPPPPPRNMCCDCNTIATIFAEQTNQLIAEKQKQLDAIRDHIDMRAVEHLQQINKMLQDMEINADLQPIIDEIKRAEANLWNGISGG